MTNTNHSLRTRLLIGASIGSLLLAGAAEAQSNRIGQGRGGGNPAAAAARVAQAEAQRVTERNSATQRAVEAMRRAAQTRAQMNDAQVQARIAARNAINNVPNGLGAGGLQQAPDIEIDPNLWQGANGPVESAGKDGRTTVTVDQDQQRAILTWDSFNIGRETDLVFNQAYGADAVVLNRVRDASPSQIHGTLTAPGTVLILNQNGVLFGGTSSVNVRNLIASSANIADTDFLDPNRGIYSQLSGANYLASFTDAGGAITVAAGAQITTHAPASATQGGGYVMLMGTEVTNEGSIITARGQTLLSAGDDFIIRKGFGTEENQYSTTRGNEVRGLIDAESTSGTVINRGLIEAAQGDITLGGRTIRQEGVLVATTGVNQRGTIHLLNSATDAEGSVTLASGWELSDVDGKVVGSGEGLTIILPELDSEDTALNGQRDSLIEQSDKANLNRYTTTSGGFNDRSLLADRLDQSRIEIVTGGDVVFEGGSQTSAQGGQVAVQAAGRITAEDGSLIDVSGVQGIALDMESNSILVNVQGNELRDSPQNRENANLRSNDVWIDVRDLILLPDGTGGYDGDRWYTKGGLLEVGGHLNNMAHGIGEWAAIGGTITLAANEVVAQRGATFDISGGSLDYQAGWVLSTRVLGADGKLYDLANAPAGMKMVAWGDAFVREHSRWGEQYTQVWSHPISGARSVRRWSDGYTVGRDAGQLILSTPTAIMEGDIIAAVIEGERQVNARADGITDGYDVAQHTAAQAGSLVLGRYGLTAAQSGLALYDADVRIGEVADITGDLGTGDALPDERSNTVWFDAGRLNDAGLGGIELKTRGTIALESDLSLADGGRVDLVAHTIEIGGDITARSGSISATNEFVGGATQGSRVNLFDTAGRSSITVQDGVTLDLRGTWTNAFVDRQSTSGFAHRDGGSIRFSAADVTLSQGSTIDVSSGAAITANGTLLGGRGGDVTLLSDTVFGSTGAAQGTGELTLDGQIIAHGVDGGGTLTLEAGQSVVIGGQITNAEGILEAGETSGGSLVLAEDLVIRAGEVMPIDFTETITHIAPGEVLPANITWPSTRDVSILVGPEGFVLPYNESVYVGNILYSGNTQGTVVVPPGSRITAINRGFRLRAGYVVTAGIFPEGLPIPATQVAAAAGSVTAIDRTIAAGTVLPAGARLGQTVAVRPTLQIDPALFQSGFSNYTVSGLKGLTVTEGASVEAAMPVLRFAAAALASPSGADPMDELELWTPPLHLEDPQTGLLAQRGGASLTLSAGRSLVPGDTVLPHADLVIGRSATVTVDPGNRIDLAGIGQITVEGALVAKGGAISARSPMTNGLTNASLAPVVNGITRSIWIGETAVLDVAGQAFTAVDAQGRRYGRVLDGGEIVLGGSFDESTGRADASHLFLVVRDGARLDASGAAATLDLTGRGATEVASHGGAITFASFNGLDLGGSWLAEAGGTGASGGTLTVASDPALYRQSVAAGSVLSPRELIIRQTQSTPAIADGSTPLSAMQEYRFGMGAIGVDQIEAGGFDAVNLQGGALTFEHDVSLTLGRSLQLYAPVLNLAAASAADTRIALAAPYFRLSGIESRARSIPGDQLVSPSQTTDTWVGHSTSARFLVASDHIDVQRNVALRSGFDRVELISQGDIRFYGGGEQTILETPGDLVLGARQIYPGTGSGAIIRAGWLEPGGAASPLDPDRSITIVSTGEAPAAQPYSAFGSLSLIAATINQGGALRAPLGQINLGRTNAYAGDAININLLPGSLTSISSKGLTMPYGGTIDGIDWFYNGEEIRLQGVVSDYQGIRLEGAAINVEEGARLDLSGGGDLTGAGFISGRGGSIDTLRHPLIEANAGYGMSASGNAVYAIVPSYASGYAPIAPDAGAGDPMIGQQIVLDGSISGLPAGTYTLMPSTYALLPGAFRVEIPANADPRGLAASASLPDGSYLASARLGIANTAILDTLARQVILTPADVTRTYSAYNEMNYAGFVAAEASRIGVPRAMTPLDGQTLTFLFDWAPDSEARPLRFAGTADFSAGDGGYTGTASIATTYGRSLEILDGDARATETFAGVSLYADDLNALGAGRLVIGGRPNIRYNIDPQSANRVIYADMRTQNILLREGAVLRAAEVQVTANGSISIEAGAGINTLGMGETSFDSSDGYIFDSPRLVVSNGLIDVLPATSGQSTSILIGTCGGIDCDMESTLYSEGTIGFNTSGRFELGDNVRYGTRHLSLGSGAVNIGSSDAIAAAEAAGTLPSGLLLNQAVLDRLMQGDISAGAPALESLILNASEAVNFFGTVKLDTYDAAGESLLANLVFGTPAVYGAGGAGDVATIRTENLVWAGATRAPGSVVTGGAGTGSGTLTVDAEHITFGYGPNVQLTGEEDAGRLALGFTTVNLNASDRITANHKGSLSVYRSQGAYVAGEGYSYAGGDLNISTPLLTGEAGSVNRITAGGAITVTSPEGGQAAEILGADSLGAELALQGKSVSIGTAVALPSGRLTVSAENDIILMDTAQLDLSGREVPFDDVKKYSWGGEVILESREGDIRQAAGSTIDLSAENNHAGRLTASALGADAGVVDLQGAILGSASGDYDAGGTIVPYRAGFIDVRAQRLADGGTLSEQFAALNARLNEGGVTGGRSFQLKQGDLTIGDGLNAGEVNVSLDGGHLTVNGTIDASGAEVGAIRLAANDGLTLSGSAVLDAHGEMLRVDSYGKIIDSPNRAIVELSSGNGLLTLTSGARIDLRHGTEATAGTGAGQHDGAARGTLELNAPRLGGAASGDIAIDASGSLMIDGARSIAVNAVQRYDDAAYGTDPAASGRPYQVIDQAYLDAKHAESSAFINAALGNAALMEGKLSGLNNAAYRDAFHLRPGVQIVSATPDGDLVVQGDLDLSGHRYESVNPNFQRTSVYGSGEVGTLTIRAGGDLAIYGSVNDGFAPPPETPDDDGWLLRPGNLSYGADLVVPNGGVTLADGTRFPSGRTLNYDLPIKVTTVAAGTRLPAEAVLNASITLPVNTILAGDVLAADGTLLHAAGSRLAEAVTLPAGARLGAGFVGPVAMNLRAMVWPKGVPLPAGTAADSSVTLDGNIGIPLGGLIPSRSFIVLPDDAIAVDLRPADAEGRQGVNWAVASMLPAGSQSWSMRLVAGADIEAADSRTLRPRNVVGNLTLADTHFSAFDRREVSGIEVWTQAGIDYWGTDIYWQDYGLSGPAKAGDPVSDPWAMGFCNQAWECEIAPPAPTWSQAGIDYWGTDDYWADYGLSGPPQAGDPVLDPQGWGFCSEAGLCILPDGDGPVIARQVVNPLFSVVRTGTGDLDLIAGGDIGMRSPYGVYTAGTQSDDVAATFNQARVTTTDGSVLGATASDYESLVAGQAALYQSWYPVNGGNLRLSAGGNLTGDAWTSGAGGASAEGHRTTQNSSTDPANWLWRQGDLAGTDSGAAWWINFGTYVASLPEYAESDADYMPYLVGFTGYGALGGGNVTVEVGGDAGTIDVLNPGRVGQDLFPRSQGLVVAIGSTGRVEADGKLSLTGGGDLDMRIGGALNPNRLAFVLQSGDSQYANHGLVGLVANLRGHAEIHAAAQGAIMLQYGTNFNFQDLKEVRAYDPFTATTARAGGGLMLMPGDSTFSLTARDDLVLGGVRDGGRTVGIDPANSADLSWFSLWTDRTAIDLFSAGGNLTPSTQVGDRDAYGTPSPDTGQTAGRFVYPAILRAVAPSGSVYMGPSTSNRSNQNYSLSTSLMLAPSSSGQLELLAGDSIYASGYAMTRSSADVSVIPTPFSPATLTNLSPLTFRSTNSLFAFGANTASGLYDLEPARFYALSGDIIGLRTGELITITNPFNSPLLGRTYYEGGGPVWMKAGRDIVGSGTELGTATGLPGELYPLNGTSTGNLIVHDSDTDVSIVSAGRDILYSSFQVAGPGTLEIAAGRNILMEDRASVTSMGPYVAGDDRPGASIALMAGMANDVNWNAIRDLYLDPANLADPERPLGEQNGIDADGFVTEVRVAPKNYGEELGEWLEGRYGFTGTGEEALAYFDALAPEHQRIFLRQVYYAETREGGREYNEADGPRFGSYLRGRLAIASLFPDKDVDGNAIERNGDIIMFGGSGVRTNFGGDIEMMAPGGQIVVGVQGVVPPPSAGVITQGTGDINLFSEQSILLGLSRIMTTFGGSIFGWSEEGDINAGRGAKTTVLYTPPLRTYDAYGNVRLAPQVPSSGAGIGTLNPIPEVAPGDIDLVAPLGTIDAGEAGIRVSGNINLAALQVLNAANIKVQGEAAGIPVVAAVNTGALTSASSASSAVANEAARIAERSRPQVRTEIPTILNVRFLGFGE